MFKKLKVKMVFVYIVAVTLASVFFILFSMLYSYFRGPSMAYNLLADLKSSSSERVEKIETALNHNNESRIQEIFMPKKMYPGERIQVIKMDGSVLADSHPGLSKNEEDTIPIQEAVDYLYLYSKQLWEVKYVDKLPFVVEIKKDGQIWGLYIITIPSSSIPNVDHITSPPGTLFWVISLLITIILIGFILLSVYGRILVNPILKLSSIVEQFAHGNLSARVEFKRMDEIGTLGRDINVMADNLQKANRKIEELDKARRYMVAAASHDLRTPLTAVLAHAEALENGITDNPQASLSVIHNKGLLLKGLIDDLFELASLDAHQEQWDRVRLNLTELVRREVVAIFPKVETSGIEIDIDVPEEEYWVNITPGKIERVISNFLENALKYGAIGKWMRVRLCSENNWVRVEVADRGSGISPEERERVFDRFYRSDTARTSRMGGSGLGLSIAREIILRHDGRIGVDSPEEGYTCFWFELPMI
ncbi:sensor histidine kinase [Bacillus sp. USDA818B3_A]|uniref:sensor histidine kinase n=1 Tax=Bacillus sp. USDA818B3_A TaxID=2698834 RepID=UPI001368020C|nr:HAMP domain-containing sensor histidine kinase [Bacillus sp. USDA818B3_A]